MGRQPGKATRMILITGALGSLGTALLAALDGRPEAVVTTDMGNMDVRVPGVVNAVVKKHQPTLIYHLAGAKSAPGGEQEPWNTTLTNVAGTWHVLQAAEQVGAKVITASTCKACDPETVYGSSKLIAERMTLAAGGS